MGKSNNSRRGIRASKKDKCAGAQKHQRKMRAQTREFSALQQLQPDYPAPVRREQ